MPAPDPETAAAQFRALALGTLGDPPLPPDDDARRRWAATMTDELGARPRHVVPLLHRLAGLPPELSEPAASAEEALWRELWAPDADPDALVIPGEGPLLERRGAALESWTESELAALHALCAHAEEARAPELWRRLWSAADWHARELQPDNATGRPWAVHVFLLRAHTCEDPDGAAMAHLHAQTLVHNCRVTLGRPDRLSACILLDAAETLSRLQARSVSDGFSSPG